MVASNDNKLDLESGCDSSGETTTRKPHFIERCWYDASPGVLSLLKPLEYTFKLLAQKRKIQHKSEAFLPPVPTIIVGNITVGGTGKTPIVIALIDYLQSKGYRPGVVSRGYGRQSQGLFVVDHESSIDDVGDEPLLIHRQAGCPVVVCADRVAASKKLVELGGVDIILADDGLQHYRLDRHIEIAVIDSKRLFGNMRCLPVGPLREPVARLNSVTCVVVNNTQEGKKLEPPLSLLNVPIFSAEVKPIMWKSVTSDAQRPLDFFAGQTIHAVAGIGDPKKFFDTLNNLGLTFKPQIFPDHHPFKKTDFDFLSTLTKSVPCVMTSKDAVKCSQFELDNCWYLDIRTQLPTALFSSLDVWLSKAFDHKKSLN